VHHRLEQVLGLLRADHDVTQLAWAGRGAARVHREGQHVGGPIGAALLAIERTNRVLADELDGEVAVLDAGRRERRERRTAELLGRVDEVDLDQGCEPQVT
jgi:hypothetical protein